MSNHSRATGQIVPAVGIYVADHTNCIPRSELPGLPVGLLPPFTCAGYTDIWASRSDGEPDAVVHAKYSAFQQWLCDLLNTCYPAPTATKEG